MTYFFAAAISKESISLPTDLLALQSWDSKEIQFSNKACYHFINHINVRNTPTVSLIFFKDLRTNE